MTKTERISRFFNRMADLGFTYEEASKLRRIEMTLSRWSELECGDSNAFNSWSIERDPETEKPSMVTHTNTGKSYQTPIADREKGALKRLATIMSKHPKLVSYNQGDPRGCALYILRKSDVRKGESIDSVYNRGVAVCY